MGISPQEHTDSRLTSSCSECQRRKQKCSRQWPCNHCQSRKVPHLCQFGQKKVQQDSNPSSISSEAVNEPKKRTFTEASDSAAVSLGSPYDEGENGLKAWGYMPGHVHYNLSKFDARNSESGDPSTEIQQSTEVDKVLHTVPPRSITDSVVNHFLNVVNHRYNAIYSPTFTDQYVQWWSDRANGKRLSPEFTCLLLRICAYCVQFLTIPLRKMVEFEMACSLQVLAERFYTAAEQLTVSFTAAKTCIERVQEQFLKCAYLKGESKMVESWHALGCTVREAQELGIDKEVRPQGLSEFDVELRRRLWTLLYVWDWQMSAWLGRPHVVDQKDVSFTYPSLRLDESDARPNLLSPFTHIVLMAKLCRRVASQMGDVQIVSGVSPEQVLAVQAECQGFIDELPPIFRLTDTDLSLDAEHPYFVFQRCQLHVCLYLTMLDFMKTYLTRDPRQLTSPNDCEFRKLGVELALKQLVVSRRLFDHEFPINAKFHLVVFSLFDTATILCSAIIHDVDKTLPHREEIMDAIDTTLDMLHQLSLTTKIGASSYRFLLHLVQAAPALAKHKKTRKRQKFETIDTSESQSSSPIEQVHTAPSSISPQPSAELMIEPSLYSNDPFPVMSTTGDLSFDMDQFLAQNPFDTTPQVDMNGLEQIWNWEHLNLDTYSSHENLPQLL
ncbi:hypothetical protein BDV95DRAFT_491779 [Massariosphaeria phaeospora]|uniref:Zn(2)-C6 fungal-type domain-containing protein n=1 Tax=Massariosphaeria phaeospora TaxID=100035 RepID=A0A7C8MFY0_9PLEO|nr:hypothetical protein BDV95DRAFT_491779 [Massariosphaeria phaeospora]